MTSIETKELKIIFEKIISFFESIGLTHIQLNTDFYKYISTDEWDDFSGNASDCIGSIKDDWKTLNEHINNDLISVLDVERLAHILRAIQEETLG